MKNLSYARMEELLQEGEYKGDDSAAQARKRGNASVTAPTSTEVTSTPRAGDATPAQQVVLGRGTKKAKVPFMRRMGRLVGKWATKAGRHMDPFQ